MARFTLQQLEYFRATLEQGSFAAAAEELRVSATAVAAAVSALERALGTQLCIRRKSHGVAATPTGSYVLAQARRLLTDANELEFSIHLGDGALRGPISLGCYSTLAPTVLPAVAAGFEPLHPGVQLSYRDGSSDELIDLLCDGKLDLVLTYRLSLPDGVEETVLYDTAVHALLAADHPLAQEPSISLHDLEEDPLIMLDLQPGSRHTLDMLYDAGINPRVRHRTPNFELVRSMVARGLGYSLLVQKPHIDHSYEGLPLAAVPIYPEMSRVTAVIVWQTGSHLSERVQELIDFILATIGPAQLNVLPAHDV